MEQLGPRGGTTADLSSTRRRTRCGTIRWYEAVPETILVGGLSLFAITEPRAALSAVKSGTAVALVLIVTLGWLVARAISIVTVRWAGVRLGLFGVAALAILRVVVLPAYQNHTVVEALPGLPVPAGAARSESAPSTAPTPLATGGLTGIDHRASGTVTIYRQLEGHLVLGLEDFDIQPGPAYALFVVPGPDRHDHDRGTRLDALRGNKGTQYYGVPDGLAVDQGPWTVLVWCETFDVPVANASPT
ncbi:MAG: hypothetical protein QOE63_273 [Acidimicrobiaceae bacterium]